MDLPEAEHKALIDAVRTYFMIAIGAAEAQITAHDIAWQSAFIVTVVNTLIALTTSDTHRLKFETVEELIPFIMINLKDTYAYGRLAEAARARSN